VDIFGEAPSAFCRRDSIRSLKPYASNKSTVQHVANSVVSKAHFFVVCLANKQAADEILVRAIGRAVRPDAARQHVIIVHGSGELAEDRAQARGAVPTWKGGLLDVQENVRDEIDLSARDLNKRLAALMTDEGVSAIPLHGRDRGILTLGKDHRLDADWKYLEEILTRGVVIVLSAVARQRMGVREVGVAVLGEALVRAADRDTPWTTHLVFLAPEGKRGVVRDGSLVSDIAVEELSEVVRWLPSGSLEGVSVSGLSVTVRAPRDAFSVHGESGTRITK
jgi:hypothetical protein